MIYLLDGFLQTPLLINQWEFGTSHCDPSSTWCTWGIECRFASSVTSLALQLLIMSVYSGCLALVVSKQIGRKQAEIKRSKLKIASTAHCKPMPPAVALISGSGVTLYFLQIFKYMVCSWPRYFAIKLSISVLS